MRRLFFTVSTLIWLVLVMADAGLTRVMIVDPGVPDTVYSDSSFTVVGDPAILPIYFINDEPLAAIEVTLCHSSPQAVIDSFSFIAGRVEYLNIKGTSILEDTVTIYAYQSDEMEILPGSGLLGHLYISYPPVTLPHLIEIDTTTVIIDLLERGNYFSVQELESFTPQFRKGCRNLQLTCCTGPSGNIDGSQSKLVDIVDLTFLILYLFVEGSRVPPCPASGNVDGSVDGVVDIGDLTRLIGYLFIDTPANPLIDCP